MIRFRGVKPTLRSILTRPEESIRIAVAAGLTIFFSLLSPGFLTFLNLSTLGGIFAIYLLASLGPTFTIIAGSLDLSYSGVLTLTGAVIAILSSTTGFASIGAGLMVGVVVGLINGLLLTKIRIPSFLATLGILFFLQGASTYLTGGF